MTMPALVLLPAALISAFSVVASTPAQAHTPSQVEERRVHIEDRARSQIGAPYSYGGSSPAGFDCSGFTRWVFADHGADLPHSSDAQFDMAQEEGHVRLWDRENLKPGDLVFHKTTSERVGHAGIYIGNGKFISATSSEGVQIRSLYDSYWGPRWVGATRVKTLRD